MSVHPNEDKVSFQREDYKEYLPIWKKCRDCVDGEEAVKNGGTMYLPMLSASKSAVDLTVHQNHYQAYKRRASFYSASGRTVSGISGIVFRKEPIIENMKNEKYLEKIGKGDIPFHVFAKEVFKNVFVAGRHGVLADFPGEDDVPADRYPYLVEYKTESIINWSTDAEGNLELIVLYEIVEERTGKFVVQDVEQIRVLEIINDSEGSKPYYRQTLYRQIKDKTDEWIPFSSKIPTFRGKKIDKIPFIIITPNGITCKIEKPAILDLVNVNISHYRNSADIEHGLHYTALPLAFFAGVKLKDDVIIGSPVAVSSEDPAARAFYLEFSGSGLGAIKNMMAEKEKQMAVLGARMLEEQQKSVEAADTQRTRRSGEESIVASIAKNVSLGLEYILKIMEEWGGAKSEDLSVRLNSDFSDFVINPTMVEKLFMMLQSGALSEEAFFYNLQRGEIYPEGWSFDKEQELLEQQAPQIFGQSNAQNRILSFNSRNELLDREITTKEEKASGEQ